MIQTSRYIQISQVDSNQIEIEHLITGKRIAVNQGVQDLLSLLKTAQEEDKVLDYLHSNNSDSTEVLKILDYLKLNKFVVSTEVDSDFFTKSKAPNIFGFPYYNEHNSNQREVVFLGVGYGGGNMINQNCRKFPAFIRQYLNASRASLNSLSTQSDLGFISGLVDFSRLKTSIQKKSIKDWGDIYILPQEYCFSVFEKIHYFTKSIINNNNIPFIIGGDHSISYPIIKAFSQFYPQFQILHFDAHTDYEDSKLLEIYEKNGQVGINHGNFLFHCLKFENISQVTQIGLRGFQSSRKSPDKRVRSIWVDEIIEWEKLEIDRTIPVYITFDIDVFDPSIAPGTATPVPNGFTYSKIINVFESILPSIDIIGVDFVEVNPDLDNFNITNQLAINVLTLLLNYIKL